MEYTTDIEHTSTTNGLKASYVAPTTTLHPWYFKNEVF